MHQFGFNFLSLSDRLSVSKVIACCFDKISDIIHMDELYNRYEIPSRLQFVFNKCMRKESSQKQEVGRNRDKIVHRFI